MSLLASGGWSPLNFDPGTLIWTFAVFTAVVLIMAKFIWRPLMNAMEAREQSVQSGLEEAANAREESRRLSAEFDEKFRQARAEAQAIADQARAAAEKLAADIEAAAQANAESLLQRARDEISMAQRQALEEVRDLAVDLSVRAAGAVLSKSVDGEDNRKLAAKVIRMVKKEGTGS